MKTPPIECALISLIGLCCLKASIACSPLPDASVFKSYTEHAKVFLGTIEAKSALGKDTYDVRVDEAFKGLADRGKPRSVISVAFNIRGPCGFDAPNLGSRVLMFMNDGDVVSSTSGSRFIWRETEQSEANLNPSFDDLVLLRRMLGFQWPAVPDEETAIHLAMKAMIPVFGKQAVTRNMPYKATFDEGKPTSEDRVWQVRGTRRCDGSSKRCRDVVLRASVNKWSGDVVRVHSD